VISRFFIDRPIFASVLSIVITLAGGLSIFALPLALYPPVSPPVVQVDCNYPGASAQVVSESVAVPIEQQVNGVENMLYMSSQCTNDGSYNLTVTFKHGVDLNMAQVLVQNRVVLAVPMLPDVIKQTGVNVKKKSPDILLALAINSPPTEDHPKGVYDQLYLSNYALIQVKDQLARLPGVSDVLMLGQRDYSMRIWVDPDKLAARSMTAGDVVRAIREQNQQVATGQIGQQPAPAGQPMQITLSTLGRLVDVEQFRNIIVRSMPDGRVVRIKDIARVELGAKNQDITCVVNGKPSVSLAVFQLPDANALDTAVLVKDKMKELARDFPPGLDYEIRYDTTPYITESIMEVVKTLQEAVILVAVVVLLFLQNWRSAIIPLIAVPVAIVGTFAVMAAIGFSLNNLTLFGLVLAIGIVVDDAIVVVEAVEHHIEHGLSPRDATIRAMDEVAGPVIAIGLVLSAVFVPCAFITGIVGQFFRQFALTIASSTIISAFNSLTLSPALAAMLLRPKSKERATEPLPRLAFVLLGGWLGWRYLGPWLMPHLIEALAGHSLPLGVTDVSKAASVLSAVAGVGVGWLISRLLNRLLGGFFGLFNAGFRLVTGVYTRMVGGMLKVSIIVLLVYGGLLYLTYDRFQATPKGFVPTADMGYLLINVQLPDSASLERTHEVTTRIEALAHAVPGIRHSQSMTGQSLLLSANGSNFGSMFVIFDSFELRREPKNFEKTYEDTVNRWPKLYDNSYQAYFEGFGDGKQGAKKQEGKPPVYDEGYTTAQAGKPPMTYDAFKAARKHAPETYGPAPILTIHDLTGDAIANQMRAIYAVEVPDAMVTVLGPPPVRGVGRAGGFKYMVEDRGDNGSQPLQAMTESLVERAKTDPAVSPKLVGMTSVFRANVPQIYVDVDRKKCLTKDVQLQDLFDTLRIYLGSLYVNDFNRFGRTWQVIVQADADFRNNVKDVRNLKVRNQQAKMVPVGAVANIDERNGPLVLMRYNMYPAAPINGAAAPGVSTGTAIEVMDGLARDGLPASMSTEWTELAYFELQAGNTAMIVFGFAVVMVFLVLAAQYESWSLPLAIILVVPMCLLSAIIGVRYTNGDINIFTQIGFVVLVGLASKNAILIVEFAKMRREEGESRAQATLDACRLRLRPIVMTSFAFILGVVPLILSHGAGAEMRRILGVTVFSGMLGVTLFGIFLTPVFFFVIDWLSETRVFRSRAMQWLSYGILFLALLPISPLLLLIKYLRGELVRRPQRVRLPQPPPVEPEPSPEDAGELIEQK
jgi:multidrug efflux pump subunit AcrB